MISADIYMLIFTCVAVLLVLLIMPSIIHIAQTYSLFDDHSLSRKEHGYGIPRLGGIAFFISCMLTSLFIVKNGTDLPIHQLYAASIILFGVGIKDDLTGVHFHTKLFVQAIVAFIIVVPGDIRIDNLHGMFAIYQISYATGALISIVLIMFIINSFNLIDGIDGLAGTLGVIACCTFGYNFILLHQLVLAALALAVAGSLVAFLAYNYSPARIFMGDAGSMFIGMICAVFAIKFIAINEASAATTLQCAPALAVAVLIIPAFDTLSVMATRIYHKKSPFKPDRNHIHHRMLRLGLTHMQTTLILATLNILFIALALLFEQININYVLSVFTSVLFLLNAIVSRITRVKVKSEYPMGSMIS